MHGHSEGKTRKLNRHFQSGRNSGMRNFNYIWLKTCHFREYQMAVDSFWQLCFDNILLLPKYNRIYFRMSGSPEDVFKPYILPVDFKWQFSGKEFSTYDLYNQYQNNPETFHNVSMDLTTISVAGTNVPVYAIRFNDEIHEPDEYYIEYKLKNTNAENIHFTYRVIGGDGYLNYKDGGQYTINVEPLHCSSASGELYHFCWTEILHNLDRLYFLSHSRKYVGTKRYEQRGFIFLPINGIIGGIKEGIDINNIYDNHGNWNLGTTLSSHDVFDFTWKYNGPRNTSHKIYAGSTEEVYSRFNCSASYYDIGIRTGSIVQACTYLNRDYGVLTYEGSAFNFEGNDIIETDLAYIEYYGLAGDPDEIYMDWIQLQKWRVIL